MPTMEEFLGILHRS